uniref:Uncharacterized protein n=1 Tax=Anguilla anguilla TaxID=7936 RepID=A0A0E9RWY1_ANGAN
MNVRDLPPASVASVTVMSLLARCTKRTDRNK